MTAFINNFNKQETFWHVSKYSLGALSLSIPYFTLNELLTSFLHKQNITNIYLTHSIAGVVCMPFFACFQRFGRGFSFFESRQLAYRYVGTMVCWSLGIETLIAAYRFAQLGRLNTDHLKQQLKVRP